MINPKRFSLAATMAIVAFVTAAIPRQASQESAPLAGNVAEIAAKTDDLKTFTKLVDQAGLTDTLKGKGPFTVFAPTDKAFEKLPKDLLDKVTADPALLKKILTYHVLPDVAVASADLKEGETPKTVETETIKVAIADAPATDSTPTAKKEVTLNDKAAKVVRPDLKASNGVIHEIDAVLLPPSLSKPPSN